MMIMIIIFICLFNDHLSDIHENSPWVRCQWSGPSICWSRATSLTQTRSRSDAVTCCFHHRSVASVKMAVMMVMMVTMTSMIIMIIMIHDHHHDDQDHDPSGESITAPCPLSTSNLRETLRCRPSQVVGMIRPMTGDFEFFDPIPLQVWGLS